MRRNCKNACENEYCGNSETLNNFEVELQKYTDTDKNAGDQKTPNFRKDLLQKIMSIQTETFLKTTCLEIAGT